MAIVSGGDEAHEIDSQHSQRDMMDEEPTLENSLLRISREERKRLWWRNASINMVWFRLGQINPELLARADMHGQQ